MNRWTPLLILMLLGATAAGCLGPNTADDTNEASMMDARGVEMRTLETVAGGVEVVAAQGALSTITALDGDVALMLPGGVWVFDDARFTPGGGQSLLLGVGDTVTFLTPPFAESLAFAVSTDAFPGSYSFPEDLTATGVAASVDAEGIELVTVETPYVPGAAFVDGYQVYEWLEYQRDNFPHRTPGLPNYVKAQEYFADLFREMGYEIVVQDEYGMNDVPAPTGDPSRNIQPQSFANVYAYRPGTTGEVIGFGGHYDMVENTKEAAFDDTSGTLQTLALAKAMSEVETDVGLLFGLWGGEEDGILGSQFFASAHPDIVANMVLYINFDVAALSWPGPAIDPDPVIVSSGPDGPVADSLESQARHVWQTYVPELPEDKRIYEDIAQGQAAAVPLFEGAGVNAQSDHTPFMARGVPVFFPFTGNVSNVFATIHKPQDTVYNLTYYMATQQGVPQEGGDPEMEPAEAELGKHLLSRSTETYMYFALYNILEVDHGIFVPPVKGQADSFTQQPASG